MNIFERFKAKTPYKNKMIGRFLTSISAVLTTIETVLLTNDVSVPAWIHKAFICSAIITAIWSAYHGQKVKK